MIFAGGGAREMIFAGWCSLFFFTLKAHFISELVPERSSKLSQMQFCKAKGQKEEMWKTAKIYETIKNTFWHDNFGLLLIFQPLKKNVRVFPGDIF